MTDYPGAIAKFVPDSFSFTSNACSAVVLHKTGGDATLDAIYSTFMQSGHSVHYGVDSNGAVCQFVPEVRGAGGNCCTEPGYDPFWQPYLDQYGNLNLCTLSIEHTDASLTNSTPLTPAQQTASFKLVASLVQKYHIPLSHIKGHDSIDPQSRAHCPGNYPMAELLTFLQQGGPMSSLPTGWTDDGHTLSNPVTSFHVVLGFRDYILNYPTTHGRTWDSWNVPLESQVSSTPLEVSNPALGGGDQQAFRATVLEYTPARGVFEMWVGQEFLALRALAQPIPPPPPPPVVDPRIAQYQGLLAQINALSKI